MNDERKNNIKFLVVIILLIVIILLLLFFTRFGRIQNDYYLLPTGNVDVFDIDINCSCKDSSCTPYDKDGNVIPTFNEVTDKDVLGKVFVDDINGNYVYQQNLKIFTNSAFYYTEKIAPGVSNTYNFVVHNSMDYKLKYYIVMNEETEYFINLKYRLKRNGEYVIGDDSNWVGADKLKTEFSKIDIMSSDKYALDWKWEYSDGVDSLDTSAGENMTSQYKLNIKFYFEETE